MTAEPSNACLPLQSDNQMAGTLVLVERGSCSFVDKATHVQQAGAIGMIVMNNIKDEPSFAMGFDRTAASLHIMAVMVAEDIGHQLSRSLQESDEALFASVQARDEAEQVEAAVPRIVVEHHVYVPDATQSWLQSTYREHGNTAQTWQTAMTELMTSLQHQLHDAFKQSVAP